MTVAKSVPLGADVLWPAVIDRNEFIASIFIKPARSINYVTLNFVAVRTGVDFEEVVGTV